MIQCDDAISKARRAICGAIRELTAANIPVPQALYQALAQLHSKAVPRATAGQSNERRTRSRGRKLDGSQCQCPGLRR